MNDFLIAEGEEAKKLAEQQNTPREKVNYVRLKAGEGIRVKVLDPKFPSVYEHGDYAERIPSHLCTAPKSGMKCRSCDAGVKRSIRYIVPLFDIDAKQIVIWDTSKKHVQSLYALIETYGEDIFDEVFQLKRSGATAQDTAYSFISLPPKQKAGISIPEDVAQFEYGSQERSDFYTNILRAPDDAYLDKILGGKVSSAEGQGNDHNF